MKKGIAPNCIDVQTTFFEEIVSLDGEGEPYLLSMASEDNS
jgi:hypothetical protein